MVLRNARTARYTAVLGSIALATAAHAETATITIDTSEGDPIDVEQTAETLAGGLLRFEGEMLDPDGGDWFITWSFDFVGDPRDPASIRGDADVENLSGAPIDFELTLAVPLCPVIVGASTIGAGVDIRLVTNGDGGRISAGAGEAVWSMLADGASAHELFQGPFQLAASGAGSASTGSDFGAPFPSAPGPAFTDSFGMRLAFTLTEGDTAEFSYDAFAGAASDSLEGCGGDAFGATAGDRFGTAVANAGDVDADGVDDLIVGAPYNDDNGSNAGRVYVYSGLTGDLLHTKRGGDAGNRFGWAVSGTGDVDGDGHDDFIVGAPYYRSSKGRARVYSGRTGNVLYTKKGARSGDRFGWSVSGAVDIDDDDHDDFLVGAPRNDDAGKKAGKVYVYDGATGSKLDTVAGAAKGDEFGTSVSGLGKSNGDRFEDFVVGAPKHDDGGSKRGKIYVISGKNFSVLHEVRGKKAGDQFGRAVARAGRVDGDNREDFVVGSPYHDPSGRTNAGRIDVYSGRSGEQLWGKSGQNEGDRLGWSVGGAGDVDDDGHDDVLAGAPWFDGGSGDNLGRVYVRSGDGGSTIDTTEGAGGGDQLGFAVAGMDVAGPEIAVGAPKDDDVAADAGQVYRVAY